MANLQCGVIVTRARNTLLDPGTGPAAPAWTDPELIDYTAAAQTAVLDLKPDANVIFEALVLASGSQQSLPAGSIQLMELLSNVIDGSTIRIIDRETLDHSYPNWQALQNPSTQVVRRYVYDKRFPLMFWVTPGVQAATEVNAVYSALPTRPAALTDPLGINDTYETALWAYVVSLAYAKNSSRFDPQKAAAFMALFTANVTGRTQAQAALVPDPQA